MPHSNDRTIISAAGDGEVRIFDIEYSGQSQSSLPSRGATLGATARSRGLENVYNGVRYLSQADTGAKVFRSHSDRVKRIVTESSPYFFLTCSEDGEVRQWDIREPESAYPSARPRHGFGNEAGKEANIPPPLISYKRYQLDLNTISCSPSQPHYIALGGAHLHCFLHDRRMLGRDRLAERGARLPSPSIHSDHDDELMGQATQCVRKFAPNGQQRMKRTDSGHITACKISDANPNEMVVSWSGEWIYSFDLLRSPDAGEGAKDSSSRISSGAGRSVKESKDRKRKRTKAGSTVSLSHEGVERAGSRQRTESSSGTADVALRVQYQNGQTEEIPIEPPRARSPTSEAIESLVPESQQLSFRIAKGSVQIRKHLFTPGTARQTLTADPTSRTTSFTSAVGFAASILPDMSEISRTWRYPVNPLDVDIVFQKRLKSNRESSWRFVQAAGTLARVLGGKLRTGGSGPSPALDLFAQIQPAPTEGVAIEQHQQFGYDFLKAILLWLDSGVGALLHGFIRPPGVSRGHPRFPVSEDASVGEVDDVLIPYLLSLASDKPIVNLDASRFEVDANRVVFPTEKAAVLAFSRAVKIPFEDLSSAVVLRLEAGDGAMEVERIEAQGRRAALRFWGFKVGRGVLMNAAEGVNFQFVDFAFGGLGRADESVREDESSINARLERIDPEEEEEPVESATIVSRPRPELEIGGSSTSSAHMDTSVLSSLQTPSQPGEPSRQLVQPTVAGEEQVTGGEVAEGQAPTSSDLKASVSDPAVTVEEEEEEEDDDTDDEDADGDAAEDDDDDDDDDEDEGDESEHVAMGGRFIWRSAFERSKLRERVELDVPCSSHTRVYRGHCNVKTVKDVNFYGLQDEYVVSGSDSGHLFIWDRKTTQIVNILEGDGEVVNVVQGLWTSSICVLNALSNGGYAELTFLRRQVIPMSQC